MGKGNQLIVNSLAESYKDLVKNIIILPIGMVLEVLFVFVLGFFSEPVVSLMQANLEELGSVLISKANDINNDFTAEILKSEYFRNITLLGILLWIIGYIIYCIFHGILWRFCLNIGSTNGKKQKYVSYIKKFFIVNIPWAILFAVYMIVNFFFAYVDTVGKRLEPNGFFFLENISNLILVIIAYFAFISYIKIENNGAWKSFLISIKMGFRKILWLIIMYLLILALFFIANYVMVIAGANIFVLILLGVIIILPLMIWSRVFIKKVVDAL